jgi:hypothetical protein
VLRGVLVAAQKLVSFDSRYHSGASGLVGFGAFDASVATNFCGSSQRDFKRLRQQRDDRCGSEKNARKKI